jgi:hypothetical protein
VVVVVVVVVVVAAAAAVVVVVVVVAAVFEWYDIEGLENSKVRLNFLKNIFQN